MTRNKLSQWAGAKYHNEEQVIPASLNNLSQRAGAEHRNGGEIFMTLTRKRPSQRPGTNCYNDEEQVTIMARNKLSRHAGVNHHHNEREQIARMTGTWTLNNGCSIAAFTVRLVHLFCNWAQPKSGECRWSKTGSYHFAGGDKLSILRRVCLKIHSAPLSQRSLESTRPNASKNQC